MRDIRDTLELHDHVHRAREGVGTPNRLAVFAAGLGGGRDALSGARSPRAARP